MAIPKALRYAGLAAGAGGLLAIKVPLVRRIQRKREERAKQLRRGMRRRDHFAKLPRARQYNVLYNLRKKTAGYENIYRKGYKPRRKNLKM